MAIVFNLPVFAPGAKAVFNRQGTSTPLTLYTDSGLTTPAASPLVSDSVYGVFDQLYGDGTTLATAVITASDDTAITTVEIVPWFEASSATVTTDSNDYIWSGDHSFTANLDTSSATVTWPTTIDLSASTITFPDSGDGSVAIQADPDNTQVMVRVAGAYIADGESGTFSAPQYEGMAVPARTGTGTYRFTFTTARADTNYRVIAICEKLDTPNSRVTTVTAKTTTYFDITVANSNDTARDNALMVEVLERAS